MIVGNKLYLTQDDFTTIKLLPAPEGFDGNLNVIALTMMYNYIVVLGIDRELYYLGTNESQFKRYECK